jgi:hypothetical protein
MEEQSYILIKKNIIMKFLFAFHNPKTKKYTLYYSIVLIVVSATVLFTTFEYIHQSVIQSAATFFEGFSALFMLTRNEQVGSAFLSHLSRFRGIPRL